MYFWVFGGVFHFSIFGVHLTYLKNKKHIRNDEIKLSEVYEMIDFELEEKD